MADKLTSTETFTRKAESKPAPFFPGVDPAAFAERVRLGQHNTDDEQARVNGWLGGTRDPQELAEKLRTATGGHDDVWPVTNPMPPAVASEAALHPGVDPSLVLSRDLDRLESEHEAAKAA